MFLIFMGNRKQPRVRASEQTTNYPFARQDRKYKTIGTSIHE